MDFTISRNKNYINFLANDKKKPYVFDINTGVLYSLQSKPLKNVPPKIKTCIHECRAKDMVFALMSRIIDTPYNYNNDSWNFNLSLFTTYSELFKIADKLNSLGYKYKAYSDIDKNNLTVINEHFKTFVKYFNEDNEIRISDFIEDIYPLIWAKEHNIEINEIFTIGLIRKLLNSSYTTEQINYIVRCLHRGINYYFTNSSGSFDHWSMLNKFDSYFDMCQKMNLTYEKDFFRSYINVNRMYQTYRLHLDNEAIIDNYKNRNLHFEDENFTVVIPQTVDDFYNEATQQNNCVYSCYMRDVVEHQTNVVFIRKKDNIEKSYITCEVTNNGVIRQYLLKHNQRVEPNTPEREFYYKYAEWLKENWV